MTHNIPFEIQLEIIKKVSDVKSFVRFRSVSMTWKSFIDSSEFINGFGARHTQPRSRILRYKSCLKNTPEYIYIVDDCETFKVQHKEFVVSPLVKKYRVFSAVGGTSHGLLCLFDYKSYNKDGMVVLWNPSIQKSVGIRISPSIQNSVGISIGFGVCPVTRDPTVVKVVSVNDMPWHVEVFTLSSGVWSVIPTSNLPRQSQRVLLNSPTQIDRFIYWGTFEMTFHYQGVVTNKNMIVSFDLITKEFKVINLPHNVTNELSKYTSVYTSVFVSKLRGSIVVYGKINDHGALGCGVWMMENDSSFRKPLTIGAHVIKILGFRKSGETIFVIRNEGVRPTTTLNVYDPYSQQIKNLGFSRPDGSYFMGSYKESLLLLDHLDLHIYFILMIVDQSDEGHILRCRLQSTSYLTEGPIL